MALTLYGVAGVVGAVLNHDILRPVLYRGGASRSMVTRFLYLNVAAGGALAVAGWLLAPHLLPAIFGADFGPAADLLQIMVLALPLFFVSAFSDTLLIASGAKKSVVVRLAVAVLITVALLLVVVQQDMDRLGWVVLASEAVSVLLVAPSALTAHRRLKVTSDGPAHAVP